MMDGRREATAFGKQGPLQEHCFVGVVVLRKYNSLSLTSIICCQTLYLPNKSISLDAEQSVPSSPLAEVVLPWQHRRVIKIRSDT